MWRSSILQTLARVQVTTQTYLTLLDMKATISHNAWPDLCTNGEQFTINQTDQDNYKP